MVYSANWNTVYGANWKLSLNHSGVHTEEKGFPKMLKKINRKEKSKWTKNIKEKMK